MVEEEVYIEQPIGYVKKRHRTQGSMTTFRRTASLSVHTSMFEDFKRSMVKEFEMTDVGLMAYFRGQTESGIYISQKKYARQILERFKMSGCNPVRTPVETWNKKLRRETKGEPVDPTMFKSIVGSLRYLTFTRPDIPYGVSLISRYMEMPKQEHFIAAKRILR